MGSLERNIWQEVSTLSEGELENAIKELIRNLQISEDEEQKTKIGRLILLADYLQTRQEKKILDRQDYQPIMERLGIKNGNTMRGYLVQLRDKAKYG